MLVEMSLAESLMNAIIQGRVHGVVVRRNFGSKEGDEARCFEDLAAVIGKNIDGAKAAAREQARCEVQDELRMARRRIAELEMAAK